MTLQEKRKRTFKGMGYKITWEVWRHVTSSTWLKCQMREKAVEIED